MARNTVLRLLPLLPMTLLFGSLVGDPDFGYGVLFVGWGPVDTGTRQPVRYRVRQAPRRTPLSERRRPVVILVMYQWVTMIADTMPCLSVPMVLRVAITDLSTRGSPTSRGGRASVRQ